MVAKRNPINLNMHPKTERCNDLVVGSIIPGNMNSGLPTEKLIFHLKLPLDEPPNGQEHHHEGDLRCGAETAATPTYPEGKNPRTGSTPEVRLRRTKKVSGSGLRLRRTTPTGVERGIFHQLLPLEAEEREGQLTS